MSRVSQSIALMVMLCVWCAGCNSTRGASGLSAGDGSLYRLVFPATATVLKDGQIAGAGAFVDPGGLFLTAAHVVHKPADRVELVLHDGRVVPMQTVAVDLGHDTALLEPKGGALAGVASLPVRAALPPPGAEAYMVGAPSMLEQTFLPGRVARGRLGFNFLGGKDSYTRTLLVACDAMPGASGACWVDTRGRVIGVQSAIVGDAKASHGLAFIAPGSAVLELLHERTDRPTATLGGEFVGLRTQGHGFNKRFPAGAQGVALHRVFEGGPVAKAGIPKDHLITHLDGRAAPSSDALLALVRERAPGDTVRLTVVSPDEHAEKEYAVTLGGLVWD